MIFESMAEQLRRGWGWIVLRGVLAVIFGVLALAWPLLTLFLLTMFWGAYALVDGVFALIGAFKVRDRGRPMWALLLVGIVGIVAGIFTFLWPGMTAVVLLFFIAAWAIVTGVFQIIAAIRIRKEIDNEWLLILSGLLSVVFGALVLARPGAGALTIAWLIGAYAIAFGVMLIALGFRLRGLPSAPAGAAGASA